MYGLYLDSLSLKTQYTQYQQELNVRFVIVFTIKDLFLGHLVLVMKEETFFMIVSVKEINTAC